MLSDAYTSKNSKLRIELSSGMEGLVPEISGLVMEGRREKNTLRILNELVPPGLGIALLSHRCRSFFRSGWNTAWFQFQKSSELLINLHIPQYTEDLYGSLYIPWKTQTKQPKSQAISYLRIRRWKAFYLLLRLVSVLSCITKLCSVKV